MNNVGRGGSLDNDEFSLALLNYRNTPLRGLEKSPAQLLFCRKLKDGLPCMPQDLRLHPKNLLTAEQREALLEPIYEKSGQKWSQATSQKSILSEGQLVYVQKQVGTDKGKWKNTGVIVENLGHNSYQVKLDGSGLITKRRRQFLKPYS